MGREKKERLIFNGEMNKYMCAFISLSIYHERKKERNKQTMNARMKEKERKKEKPKTSLHTFPKGISLKVNLKGRLEFELVL